MSGLRIGEVAKQSGLSVEAIRYYEQRGLLESPRRSPNGYRLYGESVVDRLQFILRAKGLGFSLEEIRELLNLQIKPGADRGDVKQLVEEKLVLIEEKLAELLRLRTVLGRLSHSCDGHGTLEACPILHFLKVGDVSDGGGEGCSQRPPPSVSGQLNP